MNTAAEITKIMDGLQDEFCRTCKHGMCLIDLKAIRDRLNGDGEQEKPTEVKSVPRKPVVKTTRSITPKQAPKVCKTCGDSKALEAFPKHKECKDGRQGTCKECKRKQDAQREGRKKKPAADTAQNQIPPAERDSDGLYVCPKCRAELSNQTAFEGHYQLRHL